MSSGAGDDLKVQGTCLVRRFGGVPISALFGASFTRELEASGNMPAKRDMTSNKMISFIPSCNTDQGD